jgi:hypothetical protein
MDTNSRHSPADRIIFAPICMPGTLLAIRHLLSANLCPSVVTFFRAWICGPRFKVGQALPRRPHHPHQIVRSVQFQLFF